MNNPRHAATWTTRPKPARPTLQQIEARAAEATLHAMWISAAATRGEASHRNAADATRNCAERCEQAADAALNAGHDDDGAKWIAQAEEAHRATRDHAAAAAAAAPATD